MLKTTVATLACALGALLCTQPAFAQTARRDTTLTVVDGDTALKQLMDGNARFISGDKMNPDRDKAARAKVATSQRPMAIILSCAD